MTDLEKIKKGESSSVLGKKGPVKLATGTRGRSHLLTTTTSKPYQVTREPGPVKQAPPETEADTDAHPGEIQTVQPEDVISDAAAETAQTEVIPLYPPAAPWKATHLQGRWTPDIHKGAYIDPGADIRGNLEIRDGCFIAAGVIISAHAPEPVVLDRGCAIFEGAVLTILPTRDGDTKIRGRLITADGDEHPIFIGKRSIIAPKAQLTGPCYIGENCLVGSGAFVFWTKIGKGTIIEPGALVMNVEIPPGLFVPAGLRLTTKENVAKLPRITERYRFRNLAEEMLKEISSRG